MHLVVYALFHCELPAGGDSERPHLPGPRSRKETNGEREERREEGERARGAAQLGGRASITTLRQLELHEWNLTKMLYKHDKWLGPEVKEVCASVSPVIRYPNTFFLTQYSSCINIFVWRVSGCVCPLVLRVGITGQPSFKRARFMSKHLRT